MITMSHSQWIACRIEGARRDILNRIQEMDYEEWAECLGALEVAADYARSTAHQLDDAQTKLREMLFDPAP